MKAGHAGNLALRRIHSGEMNDVHVEGCAECQAQLGELDAEKARFEADIPFERFAAGVERAQRAQQTPRRSWLPPVMGMAAAVVLAIGVQPLLRNNTRNKGGAGMVLRIAGPAGGPQRLAEPEVPEAIGPGERVRLGYKPGTHKFVSAVSLDEGGQVTPLYPEYGKSLPVDEGDATYYLPDSIEFTGKGTEVVVMVLTDKPLDVGTLTRAAKEAYDGAHGDLGHLGSLKVPGEQFRRVLLKP
jgi:hypothetical protein